MLRQRMGRQTGRAEMADPADQPTPFFSPDVTALTVSCESWVIKSVHRQACVYTVILIFTYL